MKKTRTKLGLIFAITLGASAAANADVLYDNIPDINALIDKPNSPGNFIPVSTYIYNNSVGRGILTTGNYIASLFSTNSSACGPGCTLDVTLNMSAQNGPNSSADATGLKLEIWSNNGNANLSNGLSGDEYPIYDNIPDAPLTITTPLTHIGNFNIKPDNSLFTGTFGAGDNGLNPNTLYWVVLRADLLPSGVNVNWSTLNDADFISLPPVEGYVDGQPRQGLFSTGGDVLYDDIFTDDQLLMRVQTTVAPVPVPGAAWLMGSALLGLLKPWRRKGGH